MSPSILHIGLQFLDPNRKEEGKCSPSFCRFGIRSFMSSSSIPDLESIPPVLQLVCRVSAVLIAKKLPAEDTVLSQNLSTILLNLTIDLSTHAISQEIVFAGALAKASRIPNLAVTQNQRKLWPIIVFTRSIQD